jgi:hypothetical protein
LADQVLLKIICLLMRWLFNLAILVIRGHRAKNAELLAPGSWPSTSCTWTLSH